MTIAVMILLVFLLVYLCWSDIIKEYIWQKFTNGKIIKLGNTDYKTYLDELTKILGIGQPCKVYLVDGILFDNRPTFQDFLLHMFHGVDLKEIAKLKKGGYHFESPCRLFPCHYIYIQKPYVYTEHCSCELHKVCHNLAHELYHVYQVENYGMLNKEEEKLIFEREVEAEAFSFAYCSNKSFSAESYVFLRGLVYFDNEQHLVEKEVASGEFEKFISLYDKYESLKKSL